MRMAQTVIAAANSVAITAHAPRLLVTRTPARKRQSVPLDLSPETRSNLKSLVDAPVREPQGTLRRLFRLDVAGGKTGTTISSTKNTRGDNFTSGKWTVFYDASNEIVSVMLVASPRPSIPLAKSNLRGAAFAEAETSIIYKSAGTTN
jgi:hypothetical protein